MASIYIPKNIDELMELSDKIISKHRQDDANSPLQNIDMEALGKKVEALKLKYRNYLDLKNKSDELKEEIQIALGIHRRQKNILPETVRSYIVQIRDVLKGTNRHSLENLRNWGYTVSAMETNEENFITSQII